VIKRPFRFSSRQPDDFGAGAARSGKQGDAGIPTKVLDKHEHLVTVRNLKTSVGTDEQAATIADVPVRE